MFPILCQLGIGGISGFFVGCAVKEIARIAIIIRVFALSLTHLAYRDVITIGYGKLMRIARVTRPTLELLAPLLSALLLQAQEGLVTHVFSSSTLLSIVWHIA